MDAKELDSLLRHWGRVFGEKPPKEWDEDESGSEMGQTHALVQAMRVDGKSNLLLDTALAKLRDRLKRARIKTAKLTSKHDPRELMAEHRCFGFQSRGGPKPMYVDPAADWVDRVAIELDRHDHTQGVVLRYEYCTRGRHRDKLGEVQKVLQAPRMSLRQYRMALDYARVWMNGALSIKKSA